MPASTRSAVSTTPSSSAFSASSIIGATRFAAKLIEFGLREFLVRLDRLAVLPDVETFARLLAEASGRDETVEPRAFARLAENFRDVGADVEADVVGKLDRPHRHAERARRFVDLFLVLALFEPLHCREHVRRQDLIDEEARHVLRDQREFIDRGDEGGALLHFLVARR